MNDDVDDDDDEKIISHVGENMELVDGEIQEEIECEIVEEVTTLFQRVENTTIIIPKVNGEIELPSTPVHVPVESELETVAISSNNAYQVVLQNYEQQSRDGKLQAKDYHKWLKVSVSWM